MKSHKKQGFSISLENTILKKPQGEVKLGHHGSIWEALKNEKLLTFINNNKFGKVKRDNKERQVWSIFYNLNIEIYFNLLYSNKILVYYYPKSTS